MMKNLILPVLGAIVTLWGCFTGVVQKDFTLREVLANLGLDGARPASPGSGNLLLRGNCEKLSDISRFIESREIKRKVRLVKSAGALQASYSQSAEGIFVARYLRGIDMILLTEAPVRR